MNDERARIERAVHDAGFTCQCCGACCSGSGNEVMVSPDEIDALCAASGLSFARIAEPYPDWIETENGGCITFGWVLCRGPDGNCIFLQNNRCSVYASRPHICRTYPFMLDGPHLLISECPAVGGDAAPDSESVADALLARRDGEDREFFATKGQYQKHISVPQTRAVIDSRGTHLWK